MRKRYQLTLTVDNVDRFYAVAERLRMPKRAAMSNVLDDSLKSITETMECFLAKGNVTLTDLFAEMGRQVGNLVEEVNKDEKQAQETKGVGKRKKRGD